MKARMLSIICLAIVFSSCTKHKTITNYCPGGSGNPITKADTMFCSAVPVVVYKTKIDYSNNVNVLINNNATQVLAFPNSTDVALQRPIALANGYYLQRMVGNAFTSITIDQYAQNGTNYTAQDLLNHLIDCAPFTEYYVGCGEDTVRLNNIIRSGQLSTTLRRLN